MTTKNLKNLEALLEAADATHAEITELAEKRAEVITKEQVKAEEKKRTAERRAEAARRAREQKYRDETQSREEEAEQLSFILGTDETTPPSMTEPAPAVELEPKVVEVEKEVPDPEMERKLQEESDRANEAERQLAEVQRQLEDCELSREPEPTPEMAPEPEPTNEVEEAPEAEEPTQVAHRVIDVRHWSWLQWLVAFIGLVLALIIFSQWPGWAARNIESEAGAVIVNLFWFAGHAGVGLFGGGWLGSLLENEDDDS